MPSIARSSTTRANAHTSDAVDYLLKNFKHKFDINGRDINGWTSLHYASARDHDDKPCVDLLLELGRNGISG